MLAPVHIGGWSLKASFRFDSWQVRKMNKGLVGCVLVHRATPSKTTHLCTSRCHPLLSIAVHATTTPHPVTRTTCATWVAPHINLDWRFTARSTKANIHNNGLWTRTTTTMPGVATQAKPRTFRKTTLASRQPHLSQYRCTIAIHTRTTCVYVFAYHNLGVRAARRHRRPAPGSAGAARQQSSHLPRNDMCVARCGCDPASEPTTGVAGHAPLQPAPATRINQGPPARCLRAARTPSAASLASSPA